MKIILTIKKPEEILDKAFRRSKEIKSPNKKEKTLNKISTVENVITDELLKIVKRLPNINNFSPFYSELFKTYINAEKYKKCAQRIRWTLKKVRQITFEYRNRIKAHTPASQFPQEISSYYGRISSLIKELRDCLEYLTHSLQIMRKFPEIDENQIVFVVAGYPNVGKSSLIKALTKSNIETQPYPFTTKDILVGKHKYFSLIDTPGILESNFNNLNNIEKKGYLALKHLSKNVLYVIDPSLSSGYSLEDQITLLKDIQEHFKPQRLIVVYNKIDLLSEEEIKKLKQTESKEDVFFTSSITKEGLKELTSYLEKTSLKYLSSKMRTYKSKY